MRKSGILLPVSSLPSKYGIGCFSKEAYKFIDRLKEAGQAYWQILPLGPTSYGDSPYQSFSTFAGNPYFIDPEDLVARGYVTAEQCNAYDFGTDIHSVDYGKIYKSRFRLLKEAFDNSHIEEDARFQEFVQKNAYWLEDYALYMAVKDGFRGICWAAWEDDIKLRTPAAMDKYRRKYAKEIAFYQFQQYLFQVQWEKLKTYANDNGIKIIGDIPIYVAFDSSDAWANPELFQFDENCEPVAVAGCPPDAFSATGQLWGNPLYNWDKMKADNYSWWKRRIGYASKLYDMIRFDHFRGLESYYAIPFGEKTARKGRWVKGPGRSFTDEMNRAFPSIHFNAEDLGYMSQEVKDLLAASNWPGMNILMFAFDPREDGEEKPEEFIENSVCYTGTHDNTTLLGWLESLPDEILNSLKAYFNSEDPKVLAEKIIQEGERSKSFLMVVPIQDWLGMGKEARINTPGTSSGNWQWRLRSMDLLKSLAPRIKKTIGDRAQ